MSYYIICARRIGITLGAQTTYLFIYVRVYIFLSCIFYFTTAFIFAWVQIYY
jgi:hypothetical protein